MLLLLVAAAVVEIVCRRRNRKGCIIVCAYVLFVESGRQKERSIVVTRRAIDVNQAV
jgi:hypothetical protein